MLDGLCKEALRVCPREGGSDDSRIADRVMNSLILQGLDRAELCR
jgi:hypothetical protein